MQEICVRHQDMIYDKYCQSCELPICVKCTEQGNPIIFSPFPQWINQSKHKTLHDIRTAYKTYRQQHREIIHTNRSETLYNSCFLLSRIKTDLKTCHKEIANHLHVSEMSAKAQKLKDLIDTVICDVKKRHERFINRKQQHKQMKRYVANIEDFEHRFEHSANRPFIFLLFLKKTSVKKQFSHLKQHDIFYLIEEIKMEHVIRLLSEIHVTEKGKRQVRNECFLELMPKPLLQKSFTVKNISDIKHISIVTSERVWVSSGFDLILTNTEGDALHHLPDMGSIYGGHTVNITDDLIYIDKVLNIKKLSKDNRSQSILIEHSGPWKPVCIYCSLSSDDLLVGMMDFTQTSKVNRYNNTGHQLQTIQHDNNGQQLYKWARYITENRNGDIVVSDYNRGVVVTDNKGSYRFSYTGIPSNSLIKPRPFGICADTLSHILILYCDHHTSTVHIIDKDGHFLLLIQKPELSLLVPSCSLGIDDKTHLWIGSCDKAFIYSYLTRQDKLPGNVKM
ncbi:uncharacterized protein LOC134279061 [Saccostrea cucullata]|uniref:uncharacterized protein LOC134279061 n=1 Tax=Saccostrea cuccullata TaxID=36930 RepID=UPI002ED6237F